MVPWGRAGPDRRPRDTGLRAVIAADEAGVYVVTNLQGVQVLRTHDASALKGLMPGLYIVNGRKVML